MQSFQLRMLNFPAERLIKPRKRLPSRTVPDFVKSLLPFSELTYPEICDESDFIAFINYFSFGINIDSADFKEYVDSNDFYTAINTNSPQYASKVLITLTYLYTSKRVLQGLVSDDSIFSFHLPYLAEASFDLECSLSLIESGYFKQSLQALRNVLEVTLLHGYFAIKDLDYEDLMNEDTLKIPGFKDVIVFLRSENIFAGDLERQVLALYKLLSGAVHSEIRKLNIERNTTDYHTFMEWHELFIKISNVHFRLIIRMIEIGI